MLYFRLYFLNPRDGSFRGFAEIEAVDDATAIATAEAGHGGQLMELWCRGRMVRTFRAEAAQALELRSAPPRLRCVGGRAGTGMAA